MNKRKGTYRISALLLVALMLFSTVGFSLDMHFCQGKLVSSSFFGDAPNCLEKAGLKNTKVCANHKTPSSPSFKKKSCCEDKLLHFQSDQDLNTQKTDFVISPQLQVFLTAYVLVFTDWTSFKAETPRFSLYKPPLLRRDIPVLVQSFLL